MTPMEPWTQAQLVIDETALASNWTACAQRTDSRIMAVVKANGYGLGLLEYAQVLVRLGADALAVHHPGEALMLRQSGVTLPILLLAACPADRMAEMLQNGIQLTVDSPWQLEQIHAVQTVLGRPAQVHLSVDTGMGQGGLRMAHLPEVARGLRGMEVVGTYTHFARATARSLRPIRRQLRQFLQAVDALRTLGVRPGLLHAANSHAFLRDPATHLDMVRLGSALLGRVVDGSRYGLQPVARLQAPIGELYHLPKGSAVGYGAAARLQRDSQLARVPMGTSSGYGRMKAPDTFRWEDAAHGVLTLLRSHGSRLTFDLEGQRAAVVGRIGLCDLVLDVTDLTVHMGDAVSTDVNPLYVDSSIPRVYVQGNSAQACQAPVQSIPKVPLVAKAAIL